MGNVIRGKKVLVPIRVKTKAQVGANDEVVRGCVCFHWYNIWSVMVCQLAPRHPSNDCASPIIHIPSSGPKSCTQAHRSLLTLTCSWPRHSEFPRKSQDSMIGSRKHASLSRTRSSSAKSHTNPVPFLSAIAEYTNPSPCIIASERYARPRSAKQIIRSNVAGLNNPVSLIRKYRKEGNDEPELLYIYKRPKVRQERSHCSHCVYLKSQDLFTSKWLPFKTA